MPNAYGLPWIGKITKKSDQGIEYTIKNFFSYTKENEYYCSRSFQFAETDRWCLAICPNAQTPENGSGWISLYICRSDDYSKDDDFDPTIVCYTFGVKKVDGRIEHLHPEVICQLADYDAPKFGYSHFLKRSMLLRRRAEMAPSDSLTLTLTWRTMEDFENLGSLDALSRELADLFISKRGSDATLMVKGKEFAVHKSILSARSPVLAAMFEVDMKEKRTGIVEISDCDPEVFGEFLMYLYSGMVFGTGTEEAACRMYHCSSNVFQLYQIAEMYDVPSLKSYCRMSILENFTADNFLDAFLLGQQFDDHYVTFKAQKYFNQHFRDITNTPEWEEFLRENTTIANELLEGTSNQSTSSLRPPNPPKRVPFGYFTDSDEEGGDWESDEKNSEWETDDEDNWEGWESDGGEYVIGKIKVKNHHEFEWTIENFFSYTKEDWFYHSPRISLSDHPSDSWYMKIHPNGKRDFGRGYMDCTGFISLHLCRAGGLSSPIGVCYTFGLKKADGTVEQFIPEATRVFEEDDDSEIGYPAFLKRSVLLRRRSEMAPSDSLTLTCTLWTTRHFKYLGSLDALSRDLVDLYISKRESDATLVVKGKEFSIHKPILSARSSVLAAMFEDDTEKRTDKIQISECDPEEFEEFLMYLYSGMVTRLETRDLYRMYTFSSDVSELYKIAVKFSVPALKSYCSMSISETIYSDNMIESFLFGRQFDDSHIMYVAQCRFNRFYRSITRYPHSYPEWEKFLIENPTVANELIEDATKEMAAKEMRQKKN